MMKAITLLVAATSFLGGSRLLLHSLFAGKRGAD